MWKGRLPPGSIHCHACPQLLVGLLHRPFFLLLLAGVPAPSLSRRGEGCRGPCLPAHSASCSTSLEKGPGHVTHMLLFHVTEMKKYAGLCRHPAPKYSVSQKVVCQRHPPKECVSRACFALHWPLHHSSPVSSLCCSFEPPTSASIPVFHGSHVKPYVVSRLSPPPPQFIHGDPVYPVACLLKVRPRGWGPVPHGMGRVGAQGKFLGPRETF